MTSNSEELRPDDIFSLSCWLVIPVRFSARLCSEDMDSSWASLRDIAEGESWINPSDQARFFLGALKGKLGFDTGDRWRLRTPPMAILKAGSGKLVIEIVDLLRLGVRGFLLIKGVSAEPVSAADLLLLNRQVAAWMPRVVAAKLPEWTTPEGPVTLRALAKSLLPKDVSLDSEVDWFGHDVPVVLTVTHETDDEVRPSAFTASILAACPPDDPSYALSRHELRRMSQHYLSIWSNWIVGQQGGRTLFFGSAESPLAVNIDRYYHLLAVLVAYQQICLWDHLARLTTMPDVGEGEAALTLRRELAEFRRTFVLPKVSNFPVGVRLYEFMRRIGSVDELAASINRDIAERDKIEQLLGQKKDGSVLTALTYVQAFAAPTACIAAIMALDKGIADPWFWGTALFSTVLAVATVLFSVRKASL